MNNQLFEEDLSRFRKRFNQTFGRQDVGNIKTRGKAILSILAIGVLYRKIGMAANIDDVKDELRLSAWHRQKLSNIFDSFEENQKERRHHASDFNQRRTTGGNLSSMRQPIPGRLAQGGRCVQRLR